MAQARAAFSDGPMRIIADRDDGLCMRILAMITAQALAEREAAEFGFVWPPDRTPEVDRHTTSDAEAVFSRKFLDRHMIAASEVDPAVTPRLGDIASVRDDLNTARKSGTLLLDAPGAAILGKDRLRDRGIFDRFGWADTIKVAMDAANRLEIPKGSVALHIRGGDILHGSNSNTGAYAHKSISVFEIEALIDRLSEDGKQIWMVGQEPDFIDCMVARYPRVRSLSTLSQGLGFDDFQMVLFDVMALSRMAKIYGGNSAVARLAERIGTARWVNTIEQTFAVDATRFLGDPLAGPEYSGVSSNLKSQSHYKLFFLAEPEDWTPTDLAHARLMLRWRPKSQFAKLILAVLCAHFSLWDEAEALARQVIGPGDHEGWPDVVVNYILWDGDRLPEAQLDVLARADPDHSPACAFLGACRSGRGFTEMRQRLMSNGLPVSDVIRAALEPKERDRS